VFPIDRKGFQVITKLATVFAVVIACLPRPAAAEPHELPTFELPPRNGVPDASTWAVAPSRPTLVAPTSPTVQPRALAGQCIQVRVLVVIYTNTAGGTVTQPQIEKLRSEVAQGQTFYWRNSRATCFLKISYEIIDDYKEIDEFWQLGPNAYWMTFWDTDGDGRSVEQDLRDRGVTNNQYSAVFNYYAWGQNGYAAAYGGAAYGVDVGFLGQTAYAAVPLCWDPETNDWYFIHEFHHELDSMFHYSGHPEYPHADVPQQLPGDFGEGYDFNAFILRTWPQAYWLELAAPWGTVIQVADVDSDGLPDSDIELPVTETSFGSSVLSADTDSDRLTDLGELAAGIFVGSNPNGGDTDADSILDGFDKYPLYSIDEYTPRGTRTIDGSIEAAWHVLGSPLANNPQPGFTPSIRTNWDPNYLYIAISINRSAYVRLYLDAENNGWWHGRDNYEIYYDPQSRAFQVRIWDCTGASPTWNYGLVSGVGYASTGSHGNYQMEFRIPASATTGLLPGNDDRIGLRVVYYVSGLEASAFEKDSFADLVLVDTNSWSRCETVAEAKTKPDRQAIELVGKTVSAVFLGSFYIQEDDRSSGVKVVSNASVAEGDRVRVIGVLGTSAGEGKGERQLENAVVDKLTASSSQ